MKLFVETFDGLEPAVVVPASWVIWNHERNGMPDHACRNCVPNGTALIDGFKCAYHRALEAKAQTFDIRGEEIK